MTLHRLASKHIGLVQERAGGEDHPLIQWALAHVGFGLDAHDEISWCSAMVSLWAWTLDLKDTKSAAARSWLTVIHALTLAEALPENDIVILKRGPGVQPDATVLAAPGHVGVYDHHDAQRVWLVGANQGNNVSLAAFPIGNILGVRRLT